MLRFLQQSILPLSLNAECVCCRFSTLLYLPLCLPLQTLWWGQPSHRVSSSALGSSPDSVHIRSPDTPTPSPRCFLCWTKGCCWRQHKPASVSLAVRGPGFQLSITWARDWPPGLAPTYAEIEAPTQFAKADVQNKWDSGRQAVVIWKAALEWNPVHWGQSWPTNTIAMGPGWGGHVKPFVFYVLSTNDWVGLDSLKSLPQLWLSWILYVPLKCVFLTLPLWYVV